MRCEKPKKVLKEFNKMSTGAASSVAREKGNSGTPPPPANNGIAILDILTLVPHSTANHFRNGMVFDSLVGWRLKVSRCLCSFKTRRSLLCLTHPAYHFTTMGVYSVQR